MYKLSVLREGCLIQQPAKDKPITTAAIGITIDRKVGIEFPLELAIVGFLGDQGFVPAVVRRGMYHQPVILLDSSVRIDLHPLTAVDNCPREIELFVEVIIVTDIADIGVAIVHADHATAARLDPDGGRGVGYVLLDPVRQLPLCGFIVETQITEITLHVGVIRNRDLVVRIRSKGADVYRGRM